MPRFEYLAREVSGHRVSGVLEAPSRQGALSALAAQQLFPLEVAAAKQEKVVAGIARRVPSRHLVAFYNQLADLLRSGVPLLRSLELLARQASHGGLRSVLDDVREQVSEGVLLAEAMRRHPKVFSELAVSMVRAGEEGAFLEDVLKRIAAFADHQQELRSRVGGAMIYPAFLLVAMSLIVTGMLVYFVPKFQPILDRLSAQGELPWATVTLLASSAWLRQYWLLLLAVTLLAIYVVRSWLSQGSGRDVWDRLWIRSAGVGPIVRSLAIARFCRILGTLLGNGVPILRSMEIASDATGNRILSGAIRSAGENISEGKSLAAPLAASGEFPEEIVEMITVGEEANNLEDVLIHVADGMERRTNRLLDTFVRLLEPIMLTVMASIVLFVVIALLWPIMQSSSLF